MKKFYTMLFALLCAAAVMAQQPNVPRAKVAKKAPANAKTFSYKDIENWTGEGTDTAALVLKWTGCENSMVFGYLYSGKKTGADMINDIVANNPRLYMMYQDSQYGQAIGGFGWDADNNGFTLLDENKAAVEPNDNGVYVITTNNYPFDNYTSASESDYWNSGWYKGYWSYYISSKDASAPGYSGTGCTGRTLENGAWDMWLFMPFSGGSNDWGPLVAAPSQKVSTGANEVNTAKTVASVKYVNLAGQVSASAFSGVNIVVTTYTDGTTSAVKVMK